MTWSRPLPARFALRHHANDRAPLDPPAGRSQVRAAGAGRERSGSVRAADVVHHVRAGNGLREGSGVVGQRQERQLLARGAVESSGAAGGCRCYLLAVCRRASDEGR